MRYTKIEINGLNAMVDITKFLMEKFPRAYCSANEKLNVLIVEDFNIEQPKTKEFSIYKCKKI